MITIRKFFDTATGEPATQIQESNIAALMASHGAINNSEVGVTSPVSITPEKKETTPVSEPTPAETATSTPTTETANPEPPKSTEEPPPVQEPQKATEPAKVTSWQEVLRSQQPESVLKELGYDDKTVQLLNKVKGYDPKVLGLIQSYEEGKHIEYLRELTTDYSKMSDEDVMRHQLRKDYPQASDKAIDALFKKEVVQLYSLDSEDEDEKADGRLLLEAKAARYRTEFVNNQEKYLIPKAPEPKPVEPDTQAQEVKQRFESYRNNFNENAYTKDVFSNKKIQIGEGDEKFTYSVDPKAISDVLYSGERWLEKTSTVVNNPDGSQTLVPNVKLQMLIGALAEYGEPFLQSYATHLKSLGGKKVVDTIENAKPPDNNATSASDKSFSTVAEAMAKSGRVNYGGHSN